MVHLPVLTRLEIHGYLLYPGTTNRPGISFDVPDGLLLVLGANGLGKTTLVTLLYRMLAGSHEMPRTNSPNERLGGRKLDPRPLTYVERNTFAARVDDRAKGALATIEFRLGDSVFLATRSLETLSLTALSCDGTDLPPDESTYEHAILDVSNFATLGDWLLALRYLVFYFEGRQALIWDETAQRQVLRLLFLSAARSAQWTSLEREILELDSLVRNQRYTLNKEARLAARLETTVVQGDDVRARLEMVQKIQSAESQRLDELSEELNLQIGRRAEARMATLQTEQLVTAARAEIETLELQTLDAAFPSTADTARYLISNILSEDNCLTCGTHVPQLRAELQARAANDECVICGSTVDRPNNAHELHPRRLQRARSNADKLAQRAELARADLLELEALVQGRLRQVQELTKSTNIRTAEIDELASRLPPDAANVIEKLSTLDRMRANLALRDDQLRTLREEFKQLIEDMNFEISFHKEAIKHTFSEYVNGFLVEDCELFWQPKADGVGETGGRVDFPAFELRMTGGSVSGPTLRSGPIQVSESQREFIDLSFRMALMQVASKGNTLVIDAPESSLDAVFVDRAAEVLSRFAALPDHRLVVTSNLIEGDLIPSLLAESGITSSRSKRVVDLLRLAAPTAATSKLKKNYDAVRTQIFARATQKLSVAGPND